MFFISDFISSDCENAILNGRIISIRRMGKIAFGVISDATANLQFVIKKDIFGDSYKETCEIISRGKHVCLSGVRWTSQSGELSLLVHSIKVVQEATTNLPDKWDGLQDPETIYRKRWISTSTDLSAAQVFNLRCNLLKHIRIYLWDANFQEWETPILGTVASGAIATPFVTHHNDYDRDLFLRIAPEVNLKKVMTGGFSRIFEIGKSFRNEGSDRSHIQEFTSIELYAAYVNAQDNLRFFLDMLNYILVSLKFYDKKVQSGDVVLDFSTIKNVKYRELFEENGLQNPDSLSNAEADELFKKKIRPNLIQPTIVRDYPAHMSPMAERYEDDPNTAQQWQFIVCGWELVKCYTELTDPVLQRKLLEEQAKAKSSGESETMELDESFLEALEYGCPPCSGLGLGIDRLVCILSGKKSLRDVIYSPIML